MTNLILTTFEWVPETPRGYVRDIRVRWALEEAGLARYPACRDNVARATARPSFVKAHADQMAHFAAAGLRT